MRKFPRANRVIDFLHKSFVLTCVGMTVLSTIMLAERTYNYFTVVKPQRLEEARRRLEEDGNKSFETEVPDIAKTLNA